VDSERNDNPPFWIMLRSSHHEKGGLLREPTLRQTGEPWKLLFGIITD